MKSELPPSNPYEEIHADLVMLLLALDEATKEKLDRVSESDEWKVGYDQGTSTAIVAFTKAYLPVLKKRSQKWEAHSRELFKQNFETN